MNERLLPPLPGFDHKIAMIRNPSCASTHSHQISNFIRVIEIVQVANYSERSVEGILTLIRSANEVDKNTIRVESTPPSHKANSEREYAII